MEKILSCKAQGLIRWMSSPTGTHKKNLMKIPSQWKIFLRELMRKSSISKDNMKGKTSIHINFTILNKLYSRTTEIESIFSNISKNSHRKIKM